MNTTLSKWALVIAVTLATMSTISAADVSLTASDGFGTSSFNAAGGWDNAAAPSSGNDYFVDGSIILRTPADGGSYTFGGDSLTVSNSGDYPNGILYKGTGDTGVITVGNLILDGGFVSHANGPADIFQLDGSISVISDSALYAKQGPINVLASVSGSAAITNPGADVDATRVLRFMSPASTFTGNLVNNGSFELVDGAVMNFVIGASGVNNSVSGTGISTVFDGVFNVDLSGAGANVGDSWAIATADNQSFGSNFSVTGFTETNDVWANGNYRFSEATGILAVVPEPAASVLALVAGALCLMGKRGR